MENIKQNYVTFWKKQIEESSKLSFYNTFKKDYKLEEYLTQIKQPQRRAYTKFRICNHKLQIEYGRYQKIHRDEIICKRCNSKSVENEYHFALECQRYEALRNNSNNIRNSLFQNDLTTDITSSSHIIIHWPRTNQPIIKTY